MLYLMLNGDHFYNGFRGGICHYALELYSIVQAVYVLCIGYAPINVKPHYPPPGLTKGLVGDFHRFDQKFCASSGVFDRSKF